MKKKIIDTDLFITKLIYKHFNIETLYSRNQAEQESIINSRSLFKFLEGNNSFFEKLYINIKDFCYTHKKIQREMSDFWIPFEVFVDHIFSIVIRSIFYYNIEADSDYENNLHFINNRVVYDRINTYTSIYHFGQKHDVVKAFIMRSMIDAKSKNFILNEFIVYKKQQKYTKEVFLKFNLIYNLSIRDRLNLELSTMPAQQLNEEYLIGASWLTLTHIYKKSHNQTQIYNRIDDGVVKKASQYEYKLNLDSCEIFKQHLHDYYKTTNWDLYIYELLEEINSLKQMIKINNSNLFKLKTVDKMSSEELILNKQPIKDEHHRPWKTLFQQTESLQLKLNKLRLRLKEAVDNLACLLLIDLDRSFYILHYYDFRGRIYPTSLIGVTYNKIIRSLLSVPDSKVGDDDIIESEFYLKFSKEIGTLPNIKLTSEYDFNILPNINKYIIANYLLEIGKLHKEKLLASKNFITLNEFLLEGIEIINNLHLYKFDFFDLFDIKRLVWAIEGIFTGERRIQILQRDSTASSFQHWGILLGIKSNQFENLNLGGTHWVDPYTTIITMFKTNHQISPYILSHTSRSKLKTIIMTMGYNATLWGSFTKFWEQIAEDTLKQFPDELLNKKREAYQFIKDFYKFLQIDLFSILFKKSRDDYKNSLDLKAIEINNTKFNFLYNKEKKEKRREIFKQNGIRVSISKTTLLTDIDWNSTMRALDPNIIHALDAALVRYILQYQNIYTIHDCFGVDISGLHILYQNINNYFSNRVDKTSFSLFILL